MVFSGDLVELTKHLHASLHLVIHPLGHKQSDAVFVIVAQHLHEVLRLIVLTTETQHQYGSSIGMQTDVTKHLPGILMVF